MTVIAIVVTFNRCALLKKFCIRCFQSIALNKIIIIDNDSNDDTAKVVHDFSEVDDIFIIITQEIIWEGLRVLSGV